MAYAYTVEIYPYTLRGRGLAFSVSVTMAGLILGQFVNPIALESIGWRYYIVFCILLFIMIILVWFLFPETKGRTLEEIAELFDGPTSGMPSLSSVNSSAMESGVVVEQDEKAIPIKIQEDN